MIVGEQIDAASRRAGRIGVAARRRYRPRELAVVLRIAIDKPAVATRSGRDADAPAIGFAQVAPRQVGNFKGNRRASARSGRRSSRSLPNAPAPRRRWNRVPLASKRTRPRQPSVVARRPDRFATTCGISPIARGLHADDRRRLVNDRGHFGKYRGRFADDRRLFLCKCALCLSTPPGANIKNRAVPKKPPGGRSRPSRSRRSATTAKLAMAVLSFALRCSSRRCQRGRPSH